MATFGFYTHFIHFGDSIIATVESLPGCLTEGKDQTETEERIREAMQGYIESKLAHGETVKSDLRDMHLEMAYLAFLGEHTGKFRYMEVDVDLEAIAKEAMTIKKS